MRRNDNTLSMVLRCAWDGDRLGIMTRNRPITATGAMISLVAHITITELRAELTEVQTANGFGNRCLMCCSKRSRLFPLGGQLKRGEIERAAGKLKQALDARSRGEICFDVLARDR